MCVTMYHFFTYWRLLLLAEAGQRQVRKREYCESNAPRSVLEVVC